MNTLIVGGEGGIGGAMINSLEGNKAGGVNYATSRRIKTSPQKTTTKWITLDLASKRSIHAATDQLKETCSTLDLVVFASGYLHGENGNPEKSIKDIESSSMIHSYLVNTIGPIIFFQNCIRPGRRMVKWKLSWNRTFWMGNPTESRRTNRDGCRRELRASSVSDLSIKCCTVRV